MTIWIQLAPAISRADCWIQLLMCIIWCKMRNSSIRYKIVLSFFTRKSRDASNAYIIEFLPPLIGCQFCNTGRNIKYHSCRSLCCRSLFIRVESFQSNNIAVLILSELEEVYVHQALMVCKAEIHKRKHNGQWHHELTWSLTKMCVIKWTSPGSSEATIGCHTPLSLPFPTTTVPVVPSLEIVRKGICLAFEPSSSRYAPSTEKSASWRRLKSAYIVGQISDDVTRILVGARHDAATTRAGEKTRNVMVFFLLDGAGYLV